MTGPWRVHFWENGGYDCMTDAFAVVRHCEGLTRSITLDMSDYGQARSWENDGDFEQAWQDARTICEALNRRDR